MGHTASPLRYPGGKTRLSRFFQILYLENGLRGGDYVEPFAGGAGLAVDLLRFEYAQTIHLNDIDPAVYAIWHSIIHNTDNFCRRISRAPLTMKEWEKQRERYFKLSDPESLDLGFAAYYMNRTNHSGVLAGGVIGGLEQKGKYKIDARFNKETSIKKVRKIASYKNRIRLYNLDAMAFLDKVTPKLDEKSLVYLDPPYYKKGQELYENHYGHDDHLMLADFVKNFDDLKWVVSYDNVPEIKAMYPGYRQQTYGISYSAGKHYDGSELIIFSDTMAVPEFDSPFDVTPKLVQDYAKYIRELSV